MNSKSQPAETSEEPFPAFYERWIKQLQDHLQRVVGTSKQQQQEQPDVHSKAIAADLAAHHRTYYTAKWAAAGKIENVLAFFSPPWLSPLETAHLWMTGWKPSMAFRMVESLSRTRAPLTSLAQLNEEQLKKVERLRIRVKLEEDKVERSMERLHVSIASNRMLELARVAYRSGGGRHVEAEVEVSGLVARLGRVAKEADIVRLMTLKGLLEVLTPKQGLDFMAVLSMLLLQQRKWGRQRMAIEQY